MPEITGYKETLLNVFLHIYVRQDPSVNEVVNLKLVPQSDLIPPYSAA
jgi:hypothetical protein